MTDTLYLEDSGQTQFAATVDRIAGDRVVLDQTAFLPPRRRSTSRHRPPQTRGRY
ncbi:Alanyl-tRNA synthetase, class IIc-like protein [Natrialba chahannaoensis JCM 10990]|uniref:Alanyl-tRNA synthetase, class IIc-like protein n=1 Tax=Natrialba chahannaoensis JCM 10990 TaxID=1227492 RepID=M0AVR5_9EURY|nr:hypothetical protein [Natrialba chahannaoensis]ELZ01484.1 Alanyl-tRNA synthetase, class IIc-like protein [Natrialba chahannaoensis JCM 10990]